jgi:hypothetical protein
MTNCLKDNQQLVLLDNILAMERLVEGRSDQVVMGSSSLSLYSPLRSPSEAPESLQLEQYEGGYYCSS